MGVVGELASPWADSRTHGLARGCLLPALAGVMNVDVDIQNQKVTVVGNVSPDEVLKKVRKTGRKAHLWMGQVVQSTEYSGAPAAGYSSVGGYASAPVTTMY